MSNNDPIGKAINDFSKDGKAPNIIVSSDLMEDDVIPVEYLFRPYELMPTVEKKALKMCSGKILDVGAGAGPHTKWLRNNGFTVTAIDTSLGAIDFLNDHFPDQQNLNLSVQDMINRGERYDTILLLMNGIGIAGKLENLPSFLSLLKKLLTENGKIICDSTDVSYFYQEEDGGMWVDLNSTYYGDFKFKMNYKKDSTEWFDWVYVDPEKFQAIAENNGFTFENVIQEEHMYLAELSVNKND
tara:strand:+ start:84203 stop:84928 length:726 start_codon:yes stop_codon:yes gene_type:complete